MRTATASVNITAVNVALSLACALTATAQPAHAHPTNGTAMAQVLDDGQVATAAAFGGWAPGSQDLIIAVAVSLAENRDSDPKATHKNLDGSTDYGLWQVNSVHGYPVDQLLTTTGNARAAFEVWQKQGWNAWTTYKTGAYLLFMPRAKQAVAHGSAEGGPAGTGTGTAPTLSTLDVIVKAINGFVGWVGNPHNWVRVAEVTIGGALVIGGLIVVANSSKTVTNVKKAIP
jgi:hypothetical protein